MRLTDAISRQKQFGHWMNGILTDLCTTWNRSDWCARKTSDLGKLMSDLSPPNSVCAA